MHLEADWPDMPSVAHGAAHRNEVKQMTSSNGNHALIPS
jgi:hypothetical protein